jgi:hypothetical protein
MYVLLFKHGQFFEAEPDPQSAFHSIPHPPALPIIVHTNEFSSIVRRVISHLL